MYHNWNAATFFLLTLEVGTLPEINEASIYIVPVIFMVKISDQ